MNSWNKSNKSGHDESDGSRFTPASIMRRLLFVCEKDVVVPVDSLKESLSSGLEDFLRQSIEAKSADLAKLNDMIGRLPTGSEEILRDLKNEKAAQTFFSVYFDCIRRLTSRKLKSLNIDLK